MFIATVLQGNINLNMIHLITDINRKENYCVIMYFSLPCRLSQICNHVAAVLFRVDAAVLAGYTNPTCTSQKAKWVVPAPKTVVEVTPISNMEIEVNKYGRKSNDRIHIACNSEL